MSNTAQISNQEQREALMGQIAKRFKLRHIRTTEEWDGSPDGFWLSAENGEIADDGRSLFDYYNESTMYYDFGVHKDFIDYVSELGYYPEWYDAGTLMLWPE